MPDAERDAEPRARTIGRLFTCASLAWIAGAAYLSWQNWPVLPLDMSGADPETKAAFDAAVMQHVLRAAFFAISVPLALFAGRWLANRAGR